MSWARHQMESPEKNRQNLTRIHVQQVWHQQPKFCCQPSRNPIFILQFICCTETTNSLNTTPSLRLICVSTTGFLPLVTEAVSQYRLMLKNLEKLNLGIPLVTQLAIIDSYICDAWNLYSNLLLTIERVITIFLEHILWRPLISVEYEVACLVNPTSIFSTLAD